MVFRKSDKVPGNAVVQAVCTRVPTSANRSALTELANDTGHKSAILMTVSISPENAMDANVSPDSMVTVSKAAVTSSTLREVSVAKFIDAVRLPSMPTENVA